MVKRVKSKGRFAYPVFSAETWRGELIRWSKAHGWPVEEVVEVRPCGQGRVQLQVKIGWTKETA